MTKVLGFRDVKSRLEGMHMQLKVPIKDDDHPVEGRMSVQGVGAPPSVGTCKSSDLGTSNFSVLRSVAFVPVGSKSGTTMLKTNGTSLANIQGTMMGR
eukprot:8584919-Karenia_brevis.AAC.1